MKKEKTVQPTSKSGGSTKPVLAAVGRPIDARTMKQLCALASDNWDTKDFWILTDGRQISIGKQKNGSPAEWIVNIPKKDFDKLIEWYTKDQFPNGG